MSFKNALHPFSKIELGSRESIQKALISLLDPLAQHTSPDGALIRVPGATGVRFDDTAVLIEGYARPLWGIASLIAGGGEYDGTHRWIEGLKAGTDPQSPEFWQLAQDSDQRMVEQCPIGFTLAVAPQFWQSLNEQQKLNVENYLASCNGRNMPNTNWLWFRVFANLGLKNNGGKFSQEQLVRDIEHLNTFYRGGGWSNDGPENIHQMDYYSSSFAIQFLQLLYAKLAGDEDPERAEEFRNRAKAFALDFVHYFDETGRALPFGRSLVYRFGVISFWGAMAYADVDLPAPLTWGVVKGIFFRHMRWWQTQHDIFGPSGCLTVGYSYPNMYIAESYNSPSSVYWCMLAFICLAAPASHPFWTAKEEPYPTGLPAVKALKQPGHIVIKSGGHTFLLSSGQMCGYPMKGMLAKYGKFAYSSAFGYSVPPGSYRLEQYALESMLGLSEDGGDTWKSRGYSSSRMVEHDGGAVLESMWRPFSDVAVTTWLLPPNVNLTPNWHLRIHKIKTGRTLETAEGSFAIGCTIESTGRNLGAYSKETGEGTSPLLLGNYDADVPEGKASGDFGAFASSVERGAVGLAALEQANDRIAVQVLADPNSNLYEQRTVIPTLIGKVEAGATKWYVTAIYAKPAGAGVNPKTYLDGWEKRPAVPQWVKNMLESPEMGQ